MILEPRHLNEEGWKTLALTLWSLRFDSGDYIENEIGPFAAEILDEAADREMARL